MRPRPKEEEVRFILEAISDYLTVEVRRSDVLSTWSGIRPLATDPNAHDTASASRDHVATVDPDGLLTITGWSRPCRAAMCAPACPMMLMIYGLGGPPVRWTCGLGGVWCFWWPPARAALYAQLHSVTVRLSAWGWRKGLHRRKPLRPRKAQLWCMCQLLPCCQVGNGPRTAGWPRTQWTWLSRQGACRIPVPAAQCTCP